jgi:hypothetical protein
VATYQDLGPSPVVPAALDPANKFVQGCWSALYPDNKLNTKMGVAEAYQITVMGGPVGSSFLLYRNNQLWNTVLQGWNNNYDPFNPLYVRQGDGLFFYWNSTAAPAPIVTIWLRADLDNPANRNQLS